MKCDELLGIILLGFIDKWSMMNCWESFFWDKDDL